MSLITHHWKFPAGENAPAQARRAASSLAKRIPAARLDDLLLLVSELVTNSVRHAGLRGTDEIELRVLVDARTVRVEVVDDGPGYEVESPSPTADRTSGWGLHLVQMLSKAWGVMSSGPSTITWFELAI